MKTPKSLKIQIVSEYNKEESLMHKTETDQYYKEKLKKAIEKFKKMVF